MSRLRDLAHRHADVGARALDVDLARRGQRRDGGGVHLRVAREELVVGVHGVLLGVERRRRSGGDEAHASLRRHYPDQVPRVCLTLPAIAGRTPSVEPNVTPKRRARPMTARPVIAPSDCESGARQRRAMVASAEPRRGIRRRRSRRRRSGRPSRRRPPPPKRSPPPKPPPPKPSRRRRSRRRRRSSATSGSLR